MATLADILADIDGTPGLIRVQTERTENISAGPLPQGKVGDVNINLAKWQVTTLRELKARTSITKFMVYVKDTGPAEEAWLETPIPEAFLKEVETYLKGLGVVAFDVEEIDEIDEYAIVVLFDLSANKIEGERQFVYRDAGSIIHKVYTGII